MLVTVGLPPVYSHLIKQPLEATLKLLEIKNNNWHRSEMIVREEATIEW